MESEFPKITDLRVLPSDYSQSAFKTKRTQINSFFLQNINKNKLTLPNTQNHKNDARQCSVEKETTKFESKIRKNVKKQSLSRENQNSSKSLKLSNLLELMRQQDNDQFSFEIQNLRQTNNCLSTKKQVTFPNNNLGELKESKNQLLTRRIEIMSNKNEKISIPIHEGLYKSNTSHKNDSLNQDYGLIPNLCNFRMKNQYSESIEFVREYKSGYTPIEMQKRNNQEVQEDKKEFNQNQPTNNKDKSTNHFIRKQQSTLSLPRTCGVSYIKPSESLLTQKLPFQPLPPLIFQGSTSCLIGSNRETTFTLDFYQKQLVQQFTTVLQNQWLPFIASDQNEMRELLLNKRTKKAKVGFVKGVQNLWPLFAQGSFILVMVSPKKITNERQVWQVFQNNLNYFKIGILSKKSTSGKKAFLKSIKSQKSETISVASFDTNPNQMKDESKNLKGRKILDSYSSKISIDFRDSPSEEKKVQNTFESLEEQLKDSRTVITMGLRLQMYVQEIDWKEKFTKENKQMLNQIIMTLKDRLQKKSIKIISQRFQLAKQNKVNYFDQKHYSLRIQSNQQKLLTTNNGKSQNYTNPINSLFDTKSNKIFSLFQEAKNTLIQNTIPCSPSYFLNNLCTEQAWKKSLRFPLYYISTRDSFAFDLIEKKTVLRRSNGRQYTKVDYYFYPDNVPINFGSEYRKLFPNLDVGVTAYHDFFTEQQLKQFEDNTFNMQKNAFKNKFAQMTVQPSIVSTKIKRTKFFFGYRYMWTRCQLSEPCSYVGAGVRKDVASPPDWTKKISDEMVKDNIVQKDFINSIAINVYHDGKEGLAQHFDDAVRFKQPIYTLRLFSDARLSFGSQFYGFCNGAFIIPLSRGCILVMEENSYAANGVKHCVRPCDMTGKSAAVILRQMHSQVVSQASKYDQLIDFPAWLSCLSENQNSITFSEQKRLEAEQIMKIKD